MANLASLDENVLRRSVLNPRVAGASVPLMVYA